MVLINSVMLGITLKEINVKVGFIGLGIMGMPMAINVSKKYSLIGYDIVLKEAPFPLASSTIEIIKQSDVVITMLPKNEHVKSVYEEAFNYVKEGQLLYLFHPRSSWVIFLCFHDNVARKPVN